MMSNRTARRASYGAVAALLALLSLSAPLRAEESMTIVSWGGSFQQTEAKAWFEPFAKATGITVHQDTWGGQLSKIRAMVDTGNVTWDVVDADFSHAITGCAEGILKPIDYKMLGDTSDFLPGTLHKCGVSSDVFALIFAYDPAKFPNGGPKTLADVFNVKKFPGKRGFRKRAKYVLEQALMADGVAPQDVYKVLSTRQGLDRAFRKLDTIKKDIIWWSSNAEAPQLLASGEVSIVQVFNGRLYDLNKTTGKHYVPIWDGEVYAPDTWIIPKGGKTHLAMKFIAYFSKPKTMARFANIYPYAPARKDALKYVSSAMLPDLPTAPQNFKRALSADEGWWADHEEAMRLRFQTWLSK